MSDLFYFVILINTSANFILLGILSNKENGQNIKKVFQATNNNSTKLTHALAVLT